MSFLGEQSESELQVPDVVGFLYEEGREILQGSGYHVQALVIQLNAGTRGRILRQQLKEEKTVELTVSNEFYDDPALDKKEVKNHGI